MSLKGWLELKLIYCSFFSQKILLPTIADKGEGAADGAAGEAAQGRAGLCSSLNQRKRESNYMWKVHH